jgi:hypothetical protein
MRATLLLVLAVLAATVLVGCPPPPHVPTVSAAAP